LRHAERQAAEAARRNREPPKPGSARATLRTPQEADRIKASIGELHGMLQRLRSLQKNLNEGFFELGEILSTIESRKLLFQPTAARALKLDALVRAIDAIDGAPQTSAGRAAKLPLKPPR
jgi:hypothetical protein